MIVFILYFVFQMQYYCFFFNFKSILHKKHTILCSTEYLLHKKLHFFSISLFSHEQKSEHNFLLLLSDNRYRNRRLAVEVVGEFHVSVKRDCFAQARAHFNVRASVVENLHYVLVGVLVVCGEQMQCGEHFLVVAHQSSRGDCRLEIQSFSAAVGQRIGLPEVRQIRHYGVAFHGEEVAVGERAADSAIRCHAVHFDGELLAVDAIDNVFGTASFNLCFFFFCEPAARAGRGGSAQHHNNGKCYVFVRNHSVYMFVLLVQEHTTRAAPVVRDSKILIFAETTMQPLSEWVC